jgi:hypothetical protein
MVVTLPRIETVDTTPTVDTTLPAAEPLLPAAAVDTATADTALTKVPRPTTIAAAHLASPSRAAAEVDTTAPTVATALTTSPVPVLMVELEPDVLYKMHPLPRVLWRTAVVLALLVVLANTRQVLGTGTSPPRRDLCTGPMEQAQIHVPLPLPKSHSMLL